MTDNRRRFLRAGAVLAFICGVINAGAWIGAAWFSDDHIRSQGYGGATIACFAFATTLLLTVRVFVVEDRLAKLESARDEAHRA